MRPPVSSAESITRAGWSGWKTSTVCQPMRTAGSASKRTSTRRSPRCSGSSTSTGGGLAPRGKSPKYRRAQRSILTRAHVPHDRHHRVVRAVVAPVVVRNLLARVRAHVTRPAHHRHAVGMCLVGRGQVGLVEESPRVRVDPGETFFQDHVPLGIELPEHRVGHPVRLEHEPELGPVGRHLHVIERGLVGRDRVQATRPIAGQNPVQLVGHHHGSCAVLEGGAAALPARGCRPGRHRAGSAPPAASRARRP